MECQLSLSTTYEEIINMIKICGCYKIKCGLFKLIDITHSKKIIELYEKIPIKITRVDVYVWAYKNMILNNCNGKDLLRQNCLLNPYNPGFKIKIAESPLHGKGVFACENINKNEIITIYPFHEFDGHEKYISYLCDIVIAGNPNKIDNINLIGHMLNDNFDYELFKNKKEYVENNNCMFMGSDKLQVIFLITTKKIKKGDELTVSYSSEYWDLFCV